MSSAVLVSSLAILLAAVVVVKARRPSPPHAVLSVAPRPPAEVQTIRLVSSPRVLGPATGVNVTDPLGPPAYRNAGPYGVVGSIVAETANGTRQILPLYAREAPYRRGRYNYYTTTDTNNPVQVAVSFNKRNCLQELGCDQIQDGDQVDVSAYGPYPFKVSLYST